MKKAIIFLLVGLVLFLTQGIYPQDKGDTPQEKLLNELHRLGTRIGVLSALNKLNLSKEQAKTLYDDTKKAQEMRAEFIKKNDKILEEQEEIFKRFKKEAIENKGFNPKTEEETGRIDHKGKEVRKKFFEDINKLEDAVKKVLKDEQVKMVERIDFKRDEIDLIKGKDRPDKSERLREFIEKVRELGDGQFKARKDKLSERFAEILGVRWNLIDNKSSYLKKVQETLTRIRVLPIQELEKKVPEMIKDLIPKDRLKEISKELEEIHELHYGSIGNIGRFLIYEETLGILAKRFGFSPTKSIVEDSEKPCGKCVRELREDINLLNLLNGINLSAHQIVHLMECNKKAEKTRKENKGDLDIGIGERLKRVLEEQVQYVEKGKEISKNLLNEAHQLKKDLFRDKPREPRQRNKNREEPEVAKIVSEVSEILFDTQKELLIAYNPCLIPTKDLKDPVRVGQASDTGPLIKMLERLRGIPEKVYSDRKDIIIEKAIERAERHGKYSEKEKETNKAKLAKILEKARSMSDVDFELNKEDLVKELEFMNKKDVLKTELRELVGDENILKRKIASLLLNPRIVPLLEIRLKQLKEQQIGKPVDLDKISPADSCKEGKCAIKE